MSSVYREKLTVRCTAELSECGSYRYALGRSWDRQKPQGLFVLLNPSTATAQIFDQTLGNCGNLALQWGWGGFHVGNLFAFRATDPGELRLQQDPVGPLNDTTLRRLARGAGPIVLAWGNGHRARAKEVRQILSPRELFCIRENRGGGYLHPARIRAEDFPAPVPVRVEVDRAKAQ